MYLKIYQHSPLQKIMNFELEQSLDLNSVYETEFNLSTAQKYLTKLKSHQKTSLAGSQQPLADTADTARVQNSELYMRNVTNSVNKIRAARVENRNISYDIVNIKNAVHKLNSKVGIDELLSSIDFLNAELSSWKAIERATQNYTYCDDAPILKTAFDKAVNDSNSGKTPQYPNMYVTAYSPTLIADKTKLITEALNKMEEKRDTINVNNKIKVKISENSKKVLGL